MTTECKKVKFDINRKVEKLNDFYVFARKLEEENNSLCVEVDKKIFQLVDEWIAQTKIEPTKFTADNFKLLEKIINESILVISDEDLKVRVIRFIIESHKTRKTNYEEWTKQLDEYEKVEQEETAQVEQSPEIDEGVVISNRISEILQEAYQHEDSVIAHLLSMKKLFALKSEQESDTITHISKEIINHFNTYSDKLDFNKLNRAKLRELHEILYFSYIDIDELEKARELARVIIKSCREEEDKENLTFWQNNIKKISLKLKK